MISVRLAKYCLESANTRPGRQAGSVQLSALLALTLVFSGCEQSSPGAKQKQRDERWAKGRVFAELRVLQSPKRLLPIKPVEEDKAFAVYRQSQARMLTGPFVLQSALRKPDIAQNVLLKDQENPLEWLEKNIVVDFPATEFLRVSIRSKERVAAAQIVNAVVNAYLEEVADEELVHRQKRRRELEKALDDLSQKQKVKRARIKRIAEEVGAVNLENESSADQAAREFRELAVHELAREEFARAKEQVELAVLKATSATLSKDLEAGDEPIGSAIMARFSASIEDHSLRITEWQRILEAQAPARRRTAIQSLELTSLEKELQTDEPIIQQIRDELTRLELEPEAGSRISLFRKAEAGEGP